VTFELGRGLLLSGAVSAEKLAESLYVVASQGIPLARALVGLGMLDEARLEEELARVSPAALTHVEPLRQLMARLPLGLCHRLAVAPISVDTVKGVVDVAMLDLRDAHVTDEVAYHLKMPVRGRRATYGALREALERYPVGLRAIAAPSGGALDSRAPPRITQRLPAFPDGARLVHRKGAGAPPADSEPQSIKTRIWDSSDTSLGLGDEASWDSEPVFELRRLGPPATVQDPEPETTRAPHEENVALPLRVPIASRAPSLPYPDLGSTLAGIRAATDRDGVLGLVQVGARTAARRVALLVVRKDGRVPGPRRARRRRAALRPRRSRRRSASTRVRATSASPASRRSRAASSPTCTAAGSGRCASTPASARPTSRTSATTTSSRRGRRGSASPSTCPRRWGATRTTRAPSARSGASGVAIDSIEDMRALLGAPARPRSPRR
jgi:hypothetical protein